MTQSETNQLVDFSFELAEGEISFDLDEELYSRDAVYGAAYLFIDRCYAFLARPADKTIRVRLRAKKQTAAEQMEALAGEFANELLNQMLRQRIGDSTAKIREYYMARAFFSSDTDSTVSELLAELDSEELEEDVLEVEVPWSKGSAT